jgi:hypothetical protein
VISPRYEYLYYRKMLTRPAMLATEKRTPVTYNRKESV